MSKRGDLSALPAWLRSQADADDDVVLTAAVARRIAEALELSLDTWEVLVSLRSVMRRREKLRGEARDLVDQINRLGEDDTNDCFKLP